MKFPTKGKSASKITQVIEHKNSKLAKGNGKTSFVAYPSSMEKMPKVDKYNEEHPGKGIVCEENIPGELKGKNQWVCWKWKWDSRSKKWTKPPCNTKGTTVDHRQLKLTFKQVIEAYRTNPVIAGIGFSIRNTDHFCGVDIDNCFEEDDPNVLEKEAKKIIKTLQSYTEISPSGRGIRVFGRGNPETLGSSELHKLEIYNSGRYLTVTGIDAFDMGIIKKPKEPYKFRNIQNETNEIRQAVIEGFYNKGEISRNQDDIKKNASLYEKYNDETGTWHEDRIAKAALKIILNFKSSGYDEWIKMGMVIHHEFIAKYKDYQDTRSEADRSQAGLNLWEFWSATCHSKYVPGKCAEKWQGFKVKAKGENITLATIKYVFKKNNNKISSNVTFSVLGDISMGADYILEAHTAPTEYILEPIIPIDTCNMIHAKRGLGKTNFALGLVTAIATGGKFLKWKAPKARRVLYLDGELPKNDFISYVKQAAQLTGCDEELFKQNFRAIQSASFPDQMFPPFKYEGMEYLNGYCEMNRPEVIVIDSLATVFQWADDRQEMWQEIQQWIISKRNEGIVIILIHHDNKAGTGQRGFSNKEDILNTVIHLRPTMVHTAALGACFVIDFSKSRGFYGEDAESFIARIAREKGKYSKKKDEEGKRKREITKLEWQTHNIEDFNTEQIAKLFKEGLTASKIAHMFPERINPAVVAFYRDRAVDDGILDPKEIKYGKNGGWANKYSETPDGYAKANPRRKQEQLKKQKEEKALAKKEKRKPENVRVYTEPSKVKELVEKKIAIRKAKARVTAFLSGRTNMVKWYEELDDVEKSLFDKDVSKYGKECMKKIALKKANKEQ